MTEFAHLLPPSWQKHVQLWLEDDVPSFDIGGFVVGGRRLPLCPLLSLVLPNVRSPSESEETAFLLGKSEGVLAGVPFFTEVFRSLGCVVDWRLREGDAVSPASAPGGKVVVAQVTGKCRNILLGERTALNILTRASGVATQAQQAVALARGLGWSGHVAGTRKTTPGFRLVEKYALLVAGASTHRHDLSQMVMLKAPPMEIAIHSNPVVCNCFFLQAQAGADIVMLDNFEPEQLKATAAELKTQFPHLLIEASGGITSETMGLYLSPHVDIVSQGKLTQGYPCLDFSLKIQKADGVLPQ
ncbi:hypothetical protein BBJ28_00009030 [Nothophytophthora sp. Chile5]|nr:hypothetical protein BBJ28_00009030 [Nothophytophthora sp. Chile5]